MKQTQTKFEQIVYQLLLILKETIWNCISVIIINMIVFFDYKFDTGKLKDWKRLNALRGTYCII